MENLLCPTYPRNLNWAALYFYSKMMKFLAFATVYFLFYERFVSQIFIFIPVSFALCSDFLVIYFKVETTGYLTYVNMCASI
jgi:hypothetical protein